MISNDEIKRYAEQYHTAAFIKDDPIQFPRRYTDQRDIEISGYITSHLSYGNRTQILKAAERMDTMFSGHPYDYVMQGKWRDDFKIKGDSFYRFTSYADMCVEFAFLHDIYKWHSTMESKINTVMMMMNDIIVMKREPIMVTAHRGMLSKKPQSSMALIISFGSFVVDAPPSPEVLIILLMTPWTI